MARLLALEWDSREVRLAVASRRGGDIVVEELGAVARPPREEGQNGHDAQVADTIAQALAERQIRHGKALVAVGRTSIELKRLSFPPVPDAELPAMVRWQALREFHSLKDDWPIDYLPLASGPEEPRTVLAASISPELVGQIQEACRAAGLEVERLLLRPCAAASLFLRQPAARQEQLRLLVDLLPEEADLTVLDGEDVVFLRTARLPAYASPAEPEGLRPLAAEIRRTIAAVLNQLGSRRVEVIYFCGSQAEHAALVERLGEELGLPARLFDPLAGLVVDSRLQRQLPGGIGRFAPLLGALCDELQERPPGIDFLHPRKAPEPPRHRNRNLLAGLAAVALVALVAGGLQAKLVSLDGEIEQLAQDSKALDPLVQGTGEIERAATEIEAWTAGDVVWLDELYTLANRLPPPRDAMLTQLRFSAQAEGGVMQLEGRVREATVVDALEQRLRDEHHGVEGKGRQQAPDGRTYRWQFKSAVTIKPPSEQQPAK